MRDVSCVRLQVKEELLRPIKLLGGRWLVGWDSARRLALLDVNVSDGTRTPQKQIIWEPEGAVEYWDASLKTTEDGQLVLYVLLRDETPWYASI